MLTRVQHGCSFYNVAEDDIYKKYKSGQPVSVTPTEAFTSPGRQPSGLGKAKKPRFRSSATTPVKSFDDPFAGSGGSLSQGLAFSEPTKPGNIANAVASILMTPGSGQVVKALAGKMAQRVANVSGNAALRAASKGLEASGMGGRVYKVATESGVIPVTTKIGSKAEQAARMGGLIKRAENIADETAIDLASRALAATKAGVRQGSIAKKGIVGGFLGNQRTREPGGTKK